MTPIGERVKMQRNTILTDGLEFAILFITLLMTHYLFSGPLEYSSQLLKKLRGDSDF